MEIRQLESLLAVLESPTLTRAAEGLHLSPAAVSLQLQSLASELGTDLFVRSGRKLTPTPAALRLAEHARAVSMRLKQMKQEFADDTALDGRPFHFATGATTLIYRLGRPFKMLRKRFPQLDLHVIVLATEEIVAGVIDRQFDLGLISLPVRNDTLKIIPLFEEELLVVRPAPRHKGGAHIGTVQLKELDGAPFLLYPKHSNMRTMIDRFLDNLGVKRRVIMEASDTEAIKGLVESGFGYSILPEYALKGSKRSLQIMRVAGHRLVRSQALATSIMARPRGLTESVAAFLQEALAEK
ncbi:MAG TPA: LysR family transcriptional regulator [Candidatus Sulfotelmatobacter sp.]|nr:LysR family transcriptional regulator [Candidatus Sulfotelmatobacter sp.]